MDKVAMYKEEIYKEALLASDPIRPSNNLSGDLTGKIDSYLENKRLYRQRSEAMKNTGKKVKTLFSGAKNQRGLIDSLPKLNTDMDKTAMYKEEIYKEARRKRLTYEDQAEAWARTYRSRADHAKAINANKYVKNVNRGVLGGAAAGVGLAAATGKPGLAAVGPWAGLAAGIIPGAKERIEKGKAWREGYYTPQELKRRKWLGDYAIEAQRIRNEKGE